MSEQARVPEKRRVFDNRYVIAAVSVFLLLLIGGYIMYLKSSTGDEDRPPIIVSSGSIHIAGGDRNNPHPAWKDWLADSSVAHRWRPNHPFGASVREFQVTVSGATNPSACPSTPFAASEVQVDYSTLTTNPAVRIYAASPNAGAHKDPVVDSAVDMTVTPQSAAAPAELRYEPGSGFIPQVRAITASGTTTCTFDQSAAVVVRVQPTR